MVESYKNRHVRTEIDLSQEILGKIEYKVIDENQAIANIQFQLKRQLFDSIMRERLQKHLLEIVIDKSGSMAGQNIQLVKEQSIKLAQQYYDYSDHNVQLNTILFDTRSNEHQSRNFEDFKQFMEANCKAAGGTNFAIPLSIILDKVKSGRV